MSVYSHTHLSTNANGGEGGGSAGALANGVSSGDGGGGCGGGSGCVIQKPDFNDYYCSSCNAFEREDAEETDVLLACDGPCLRSFHLGNGTSFTDDTNWTAKPTLKPILKISNIVLWRPYSTPF